MPKTFKKAGLSICVADGFDSAAMIDYLSSVREHVDAGKVITSGRNVTVISSAPCCSGMRDVVIKAFAPSSGLGSLLNGRRLSKARRNWEAALRLHEAVQATPVPVAFVEEEGRVRSAKCFYVSEYAKDFSSFREELLHIYLKEPQAGKLMALISTVAAAVRRMHDCGVVHYDLGNQNILLRRKGDSEWGDVLFIDLNRARVVKKVSAVGRARDLSRITLPPNMMKLFVGMYCAGDIQPGTLLPLEKVSRLKYQIHHKTRLLRHPLRESGLAGTDDVWKHYPPADEVKIEDGGKWIPLTGIK